MAEEVPAQASIETLSTNITSDVSSSIDKLVDISREILDKTELQTSTLVDMLRVQKRVFDIQYAQIDRGQGWGLLNPMGGKGLLMPQTTGAASGGASSRSSPGALAGITRLVSGLAAATTTTGGLAAGGLGLAAAGLGTQVSTGVASPENELSRVLAGALVGGGGAALVGGPLGALIGAIVGGIGAYYASPKAIKQMEDEMGESLSKLADSFDGFIAKRFNSYDEVRGNMRSRELEDVQENIISLGGEFLQAREKFQEDMKQFSDSGRVGELGYLDSIRSMATQARRVGSLQGQQESEFNVEEEIIQQQERLRKEAAERKARIDLEKQQRREDIAAERDERDLGREYTKINIDLRKQEEARAEAIEQAGYEADADQGETMSDRARRGFERRLAKREKSPIWKRKRQRQLEDLTAAELTPQAEEKFDQFKTQLSNERIQQAEREDYDQAGDAVLEKQSSGTFVDENQPISKRIALLENMLENNKVEMQFLVNKGVIEGKRIVEMTPEEKKRFEELHFNNVDLMDQIGDLRFAQDQTETNNSTNDQNVGALIERDLSSDSSSVVSGYSKGEIEATPEWQAIYQNFKDESPSNSPRMEEAARSKAHLEYKRGLATGQYQPPSNVQVIPNNPLPDVPATSNDQSPDVQVVPKYDSVTPQSQTLKSQSDQVRESSVNQNITIIDAPTQNQNTSVSNNKMIAPITGYGDSAKSAISQYSH